MDGPEHAPPSERWLPAASLLLRLLIRGLMATVRFRVVAGGEHLDRLGHSGGPVLYAFWHNRLLGCGYYLYRRLVGGGGRLAVQVSRSRDGELVARVGEAFGVDVARGSVSAGGLVALRQLHRLLAREGIPVMTAADGSRGPIYRCQEGVIALAQAAGVPLVPLACAARRAWRLRSWDRLIVPRPFTTVTIAVGQPLEIPPDLPAAELAGRAAEAGERLNGLVATAEAAAGTRTRGVEAA